MSEIRRALSTSTPCVMCLLMEVLFRTYLHSDIFCILSQIAFGLSFRLGSGLTGRCLTTILNCAKCNSGDKDG